MQRGFSRAGRRTTFTRDLAAFSSRGNVTYPNHKREKTAPACNFLPVNVMCLSGGRKRTPNIVFGRGIFRLRVGDDMVL